MPKGVFWKISTNFFDNPTERKTERHEQEETKSTEIIASKKSHYIQAEEVAAFAELEPRDNMAFATVQMVGKTRGRTNVKLRSQTARWPGGKKTLSAASVLHV